MKHAELVASLAKLGIKPDSQNRVRRSDIKKALAESEATKCWVVSSKLTNESLAVFTNQAAANDFCSQKPKRYIESCELNPMPK